MPAIKFPAAIIILSDAEKLSLISSPIEKAHVKPMWLSLYVCVHPEFSQALPQVAQRNVFSV